MPNFGGGVSAKFGQHLYFYISSLRDLCHATLVNEGNIKVKAHKGILAVSRKKKGLKRTLYDEQDKYEEYKSDFIIKMKVLIKNITGLISWK